MRSVVSLAPSAFLASAVSTRSLQNELIPHIASLNDTDFDTCMAHWSELFLCDPVTGVGADKQWVLGFVGCRQNERQFVFAL